MFNRYLFQIKSMKIKWILPVALASVLTVCSCSTPKDVTYLQNLEHGSKIEIPSVNQIKVEPGDKITIVINSADAKLSDMFNLPVYTSRVGQTASSYDGKSTILNPSQYISAYTVTPEGTIDFPFLGEIKIAGMTRTQVAEYIKKQLEEKKLIKDPVVTVEFVDAAVSVMGEVTRPGRYAINRDHINILEAFTYAGDLTINGKRDNVLVLREEDGKQVAYRIDLTAPNSMLTSPVYYLQQNDIIYVEPNDMKKRSATVNGNNVLSAGFWVSVASLLTSVCVLIFK